MIDFFDLAKSIFTRLDFLTFFLLNFLDFETFIDLIFVTTLFEKAIKFDFLSLNFWELDP